MLYKIKKIFERLTGFVIFRKMPYGNDPYHDIKHTLRDYSFKLFFDIGANIGQSVFGIKKHFPNSKICCFEPVSKTFETLQKNTQTQNVDCFLIGFGAQSGEVKIDIYDDDGYSDMSSINNKKEIGDSSSKKEIINIETLDEFCNKNNISKIDYVKIDTEGYDLEVLKGGTALLKSNKISFIETEVSMNPENTYHVKFETLKNYLESFDYRLFGIYDQVHEWPKSQPILRRVNVVFVSKEIHKEKNNFIKDS